MKSKRSRFTKILSCTFAIATLSFTSVRADWVTWTVASGGNGHSYLAVPASPGLTWNVANQLAQAQGGYLATINSPEENAFVFGLVNNPQFFTAFNGSGPALGGIQLPGSAEPGGGWGWQTGEPFNYTNWLPGQPDDGLGFWNENRLHFFSYLPSTPAATWNDINEDDTNIGGYVIEAVPEPATPALLGLASILGVAFRKLRAKAS